MSEVAATYATRSPVLLGIRRAESMALAFLALATVISFGPPGVPFSFALLGAAAVLLPRRRDDVSATREDARLQVVQELIRSGRTLRAKYDRTREAGDVRAVNRALLDLRFEIIDWIASSRAQLGRYPEFRGIFDAHHGGDLYEELDGRIERLRQIARVAQTSTRLGLPI